jgi:NAD(P)-dependent dehydrogenase (short-subunit alcohol dehydrogenase family)
VIVTGAAFSTGEATAGHLSPDVSKVGLADRNAEKLRKVESQLPQSRKLAHSVDVSQAQAVNAVARTTVETFGRLDTIVDNASFVTDAMIAVDGGVWPRTVSRDIGASLLKADCLARARQNAASSSFSKEARKLSRRLSHFAAKRRIAGTSLTALGAFSNGGSATPNDRLSAGCQGDCCALLTRMTSGLPAS